MRRIIKTIIVYILGLLARGVVRRYKPTVVMVTGSVGKTATKDAVASALDANYFVRKSEKSFNSEFGVPFTILGVENPWANPIKWLSVIKSSLALLFLPNHYPNMLVLEVGADRPRDIENILHIAIPDAVVVTRLPDIPVHVEAYKSPESVREEEFLPAHALSPGCPLIVSADDMNTIDMAVRTQARVITYGESESADVRVTDINFDTDKQSVIGMMATIKSGNKSAVASVRGSVGRTQMLSLAAAVGAASAFGVPLEKSLEMLEDYMPPPGRGRVLSGIKNSIIIDDTYNSSPAAVEEALLTLRQFPNATRRIAVFGDMLELGRYSVMEHERIGALARDSADIVVAVGVRAKSFTAVEGKGEVMHFDNSGSAAAALPDIIKKGDVILVKGSQSIRTERIVKALLANPNDSTKLVRQEMAWLRRA